jgi:hypothetical protein
LRVGLQAFQRLAHQRGFAHLPWASKDLQKPARLLKAGKQRGEGFTFDGHFVFAQSIE